MKKPLPLDENPTFYDILEVGSDSSPQEIREAYLRLKSAYNKDSPALYSLMSREETEQTLREIESAYIILSNPERRKEYDHRHGLIEDSDPFITSTPKHLQKLHKQTHLTHLEAQTEIHAKKPRPAPKKVSEEDLFENSEDSSEQLLEAPMTDFTHARMQNPPTHKVTLSPEPQPKKFSPEAPLLADASLTSSEAQEDSELEDLIQRELEWRGQFIKKIREARHLSIEELADYTKISKRYLKAIEDEDYTKLPAPVYLRGFVIQMAKRLKIPSETVAAAYLARYLQACSNAEKSTR